MVNHEALLAALRTRAEDAGIRTDMALARAARTDTTAGQLLPGRASEAELAQAEFLLGFPLPQPVRLVYALVANGGFGPGYGLSGLGGGARKFGSNGHYRRCDEQYEFQRSASTYSWPRGILPLCDWGCGIYSCADCTDPAAPIVRFYGDAAADNLAPTPFTSEAPAFISWLSEWISGRSLWDEAEEAELWYPSR